MRLLLPVFLLLLFADGNSQGLKVMTYNIRNSNAADGVNNWSNRKDTLAALLHKAGPDIIGTQEVLYGQLKDLLVFLPGFKVFGAGRNNGRHAGEHSPVYYNSLKFEFIKGGNFWLSETPGKPGSKSWDAAITRICTWVELREKASGREFYVFNTHFDHKGKQARRKSAALLRHAIDSLAAGLPVIVTGDFNFEPEDEAYTVMATPHSSGISLNDSYTPGAPPFTSCGFDVSNSHCSRIDYIWHSPLFTKSGYTVHTDNNGTYYPSDHLAVSVVLHWR